MNLHGPVPESQVKAVAQGIFFVTAGIKSTLRSCNAQVANY